MPEEPLFQDPVEVKLVRHRAWVTPPEVSIAGWVEFDQYQVFVHSESLAYRNKEKRLMVGYIGIQPGASFMAANEINSFTYPHKVWIEEEVKRQHGNAGNAPHVELPPHMSMKDIVEFNEAEKANQ